MRDEAPVPERILSGKPRDEDLALDTSLRPRRLDDYIGQDKVKDNLRIAIAAAQMRGEPLDHVLLYGPPGLGKTTLAYIIAAEMGVSIRITSGPAIERPGDLAAILTNLQTGRRALHRRNPPPRPRHRGDPLSGDGGLRPRHRDRQGAGRPQRAPEAAALHPHRRHDPLRHAQPAPARPLRRRLPPRFLRHGRHRRHRPAQRPHPGRARSKRAACRRSPAAPAARRAWPTGC